MQYLFNLPDEAPEVREQLAKIVALRLGYRYIDYIANEEWCVFVIDSANRSVAAHERRAVMGLNHKIVTLQYHEGELRGVVASSTPTPTPAPRSTMFDGLPGVAVTTSTTTSTWPTVGDYYE